MDKVADCLARRVSTAAASLGQSNAGVKRFEVPCRWRHVLFEARTDWE